MSTPRRLSRFTLPRRGPFPIQLPHGAELASALQQAGRIRQRAPLKEKKHHRTCERNTIKVAIGSISQDIQLDSRACNGEPGILTANFRIPQNH